MRGNPHEIALGLALGLLVGMAPIMGIQTAFAIFLAAIIKCNKISAAIGVWITNPLSAPFIYGFNYFVGAYVLGINNVDKSPIKVDTDFFFRFVHKAPEILGALTIGGIVTGIPIAVIGYFLAYSAISKYREKLRAEIQKRRELLKKKRDKAKSRRLKRKWKKKKKI